jgi:hypothetical protein
VATGNWSPDERHKPPAGARHQKVTCEGAMPQLFCIFRKAGRQRVRSVIGALSAR